MLVGLGAARLSLEAAEADLSIACPDQAAPVNINSAVTYTIGVTNLGASAATSVQVTDVLPLPFAFVSANASQGSCSQQNGTVVCNLGDLGVSATATITVVATAQRSGVYANEVSVVANETDPVPNNNLASGNATVILPAVSFATGETILLGDILPGAATPYPSTITVSGLTSTVYKVTATLRNLAHDYPQDVDVLLVGPQGQSVLLMSDAGGPDAITNVTLTFDSAAIDLVPRLDAVLSGTYRPTDYGTTVGDTADNFPAPAPGRPWGSAMTVFNGTNPNGVWSLYVVDDLSEYGGSLENGWSLNIQTVSPLNDLGVALVAQPDSIAVGADLTYSLAVSNQGPASAINVVVTNRLPDNVNFVSATASQGSCSQAGGVVTCTIGNLGVNGIATVEIIVTTTTTGNLTATVGVTALNTDPNLANNGATATTAVLNPPMIVTSPTSLTRVPGQSAAFTVTATGDSLSYQWQKGGVDVSGATAATLTFDPVQLADAGDYTVRVSNPVGTVVSDPATLTVQAPPPITSPPQSRTNIAGTTATFTVVSSNPGPLTYAWYFQGTQLLPGADTATLTLPNVQLASAGAYHVVVTGPGGSSTSSTANLTVWEVDFGDAPAPYPTLLANDGARHILVPGVFLGLRVDHETDGAPSADALGDDSAGSPDDEDGVTLNGPWLAGQTVSITVVASVSGSLNAWADFNGNGSWADAGEQIFADQMLTAGANELTVAVPADANMGTCLVRFRFNTAGNLSFAGLAQDGEVEDYAVTINASADVAITASGLPATIPTGNNLTFNLLANNQGLSAATTVLVTNYLPTGFSFVAATPSQGSCQQADGIVRCDLGTLAPSASATIAIEVLPATAGTFDNRATIVAAPTDPVSNNNTALTTVIVLEPPTILTPLQSINATNGDTVIFSVQAGGTSLAYQWQRNGTDLPEARSATLTLDPVQPGDAGDYTVSVTNDVGAVLSSAATLTVVVPPYIIQQPECKTATEGDNYTFSVVADGDPVPTYQWRKDGLELTGQTNPTLELLNIQSGNAGDYQVVVSSTLGAVTSIVARLAVRAPGDPAYPDPQGGWAYEYSGDSVATAPTAALDGTWNHEFDSWGGDGRGPGVGAPGGVGTANGVLTIEDDVSSVIGLNDNRRIYFTHNLQRETSAATASTVLDNGITLSFRMRLTPPAPTDPLTELAPAPNGGVNKDLGKGMIGVRQGGNGSGIISFSLNQALEDTSPTTTQNFGQSGLHMNNLSTFNAFVDPGLPGTLNLLPLDPTVFHQFWITIQDNGAEDGTHRVSIYVDGSLTPTVFNVTAGAGVDLPSSDATATNYLALGQSSTPQVGAFDLDFLAYKPGVIPPTGFDDPVTIVSSPVSQVIAEGEVATFNVGVTGSPPITFQWFKDGTAISGAASDSYTTPPIVPADDGAEFTVVVDNFCGSVTSAPVTLRLLQAPQIVTQPPSLVVTNGDPASFSVAVTARREHHLPVAIERN